jgi:hypothetical protein
VAFLIFGIAAFGLVCILHFDETWIVNRFRASAAVALHLKTGRWALILKDFPVFYYNALVFKSQTAAREPQTN